MSGNMVYVARLFDKLIEAGHNEFTTARGTVLDSILNNQIPSVAKDGSLLCQFFEDHQELDN